LRIIFYSSAIFAGVGYGVATRNLLQRIKADGHEVTLATKHLLGGQIEVAGITHWDGAEINLVNVVKREEKWDYIISMMDDWVLPAGWRWDDWLSICMLDTDKIHPRLLDRATGAIKVIAPTKFTENEFRRNGFDPFYAPIGVDLNLFRPDVARRKTFREAKKWGDDKFVIGCLGINYSTDRKNFVGALRAFAEFHKNHPDSILYMHTDVMGSTTQGMNLQWIIKDLGFPEDGSGAVQYVQQSAYHRWNISDETVARTYNGIDVLCWASNGEGVGMPLMEAQACGTPAIVAATTSGRELCKGGWLIEESSDDFEYSTHQIWIKRSKPSEIEEKMELAYQAWKDGSLQQRQKEAREGMLCYDWDLVYKEYWRPILQWMEGRKNGTVFDVQYYPNYKKLHEGFGKVFDILDCERLEHDKTCHSVNFIRLAKEPEDDPRSIMARSYPIFPAADGELLVHTKCLVHKYLPPRFIAECQKVYKELWSYPKVRQEVAEKWAAGDFEAVYGSSNDWQKLSELKAEFNEEYSEIFQKLMHTTFHTDDIIYMFAKEGKTFLDVGCGEAKVVDFLNTQEGITAKGTEVNPKWIDGSKVVYGDIHSLPFEDNSFDVLLCIDVLEHVKDPHVALRELFRVAAKKLVLAITFADNPCYAEDPTHIVDWDLERWKRELSEYGNIKQIIPGKGLLLVEKRK
jgi:glycosyltransferase involved in cell wall biosynthesis